MGHQVHLQKAQFGLVPLGERPNRDLLFEQGTSFGGRKAMWVSIAMGLQQAVRGRCAHREEKATVFFVQLKVPILLRVATMLGKNGIKHFVQMRLRVFQASTNASSTSGP